MHLQVKSRSGSDTSKPPCCTPRLYIFCVNCLLHISIIYMENATDLYAHAQTVDTRHLSPRLVLVIPCSPFSTLHCSLKITDLVTMATNTWTLHTNHGIMDILSCHVYKGIHHRTNQNEPPSGIGMLYSTFPLTAINNLSHISQSHGSPKIILILPEEKVPNKIWNQN